jgi:methylglutaconyl-CoA hydratase
VSNSPVLQIESLDAATVLLTLNRPERRNALTIELMQAVCAAFEAIANEPQRRVVLIQGAGVAFCSGLDLQEAADMSVAEESASWVARLFQVVRASSLITIAMAQGAAFAGGAGLLACCDFAIGTDDLKIGFPEVRRGLIPALVAVVLADRLHQHDLNELFLIAEPIGAARAQSMGLLHHVVATDQLLSEARLLASKILNGGPDAVRETKSLVRDLRLTDPSQRISHALAVHTRIRQSEEANEGLKAFLERRDPRWSSS